MNPFEIKAEINNILEKLSDVNDFENYGIHYRKLDAEKDKTIIVKILFREINNNQSGILKFLLLRYCKKQELIDKLWALIKNDMTASKVKIFALDLLRDFDTDWSYNECSSYLDNPDELLEADTKKILDTAIGNPEYQIDFLDFLQSLEENDKIILLKSFGNDYSKDELANMLIPVFQSQPYTETGKTALELLGNSKSQLAYHALNTSLETLDEKIHPLVNKNLSILKIAGIREDNSIEFYKNILKGSKPYRCCITYPDGYGNQAVIVSRTNKNGKIQFLAVVINDEKGVKDCFGFNEISQFECNTIIEQFFKNQNVLEIKPEFIKTFLINAEKISKDKTPYEYFCWKTILADIQEEQIKLSYEIKKLNNKEFEDILQSDYTDYWFLDKDYSDEFEEFLTILNNTEPKDYEKIIDENLDKIFYSEEKNLWYNRILTVAILLHITGKNAQSIYSLFNDNELKRELLKNILRKSIYEYYTSEKNSVIVKEIEKMWVK